MRRLAHVLALLGIALVSMGSLLGSSCSSSPTAPAAPVLGETFEWLTIIGAGGRTTLGVVKVQPNGFGSSFEEGACNTALDLVLAAALDSMPRNQFQALSLGGWRWSIVQPGGRSSHDFGQLLILADGCQSFAAEVGRSWSIDGLSTVQVAQPQG